MTVRVGALVLAAGASERLGTPKQLLLGRDGRPLVSGVVHALREAGCEPIAVVVGAHAEDVTHALIEDAAAVFLVAHRGWSEGMGSSIRAGIATISTHGLMADIDAVLIAACDMPTADGAHFRALRGAAASTNGHMRVASAYTAQDGVTVTRGIPAVFPRADWPELLGLAGDRGAKALLERPDTVTVPLVDGSFDLDTPEDVAAWRASLR
ncbi:MAG: nucleotidyltransferase family protein [Gemmatimonadota bacterium]